MSIAPPSILQQHVQALSEAALQTRIVEPLLRATGFDAVRDVSGPGERGKDLVAFRRELGTSLLYAIQIKKIRVTGAIATPQSIIALVQQLYQAIQEEYFDPTTKGWRPFDRLMLITPYTIDRATFDAAVQSIQDLARRQITIVDGPTLISEALRLIPNALVSLDASIGYRTALTRELDELRESSAFGSPRRLSVQQLFVEVGLQLFDSVADLIHSVLQQRQRHWDAVRKGQQGLRLPSLTRGQINALDQASVRWSEVCDFLRAKAPRSTTSALRFRNQDRDIPTNNTHEPTSDGASATRSVARAVTMLRQVVRAIYNHRDRLGGTCSTADADQFFLAVHLLQTSMTPDARQSLTDSWGLLDDAEVQELQDTRNIVSAGRNTLNSQILHYTKHPLLIIGPPGAGKTTLLRMVTSRSAEQNDHTEPVFIRAIDIHTYNPEGILQATIDSMRQRGSNMSNDATAEALASGRLRVAIDGLDEVGDRIRQLRAGILNLVHKHPHASLIISVRDTVGFADWRDCVTIGIYPFDNIQLCTFIDNWFSTEPGSAESLKRWVLRQPHMLV